MMLMPRGYTVKSEEQQANRREKGRRVGAWLRTAIVDPATGESMSNRELARRIKKSPTMIGIWLNDCVDSDSESVKLPDDVTIEKIAQATGANAMEGLSARRFGDREIPRTADRVHEDEAMMRLPSGRAVELIASDTGLPLRLDLTPEVLAAMEAFALAQQLKRNNFRRQRPS